MNIQYEDGSETTLERLEEILSIGKGSLTHDSIKALINKIKQQEIATQMRIKLAGASLQQRLVLEDKIKEQEAIINDLKSSINELRNPEERGDWDNNLDMDYLDQSAARFD